MNQENYVMEPASGYLIISFQTLTPHQIKNMLNILDIADIAGWKSQIRLQPKVQAGLKRNTIKEMTEQT